MSSPANLDKPSRRKVGEELGKAWVGIQPLWINPIVQRRKQVKDRRNDLEHLRTRGAGRHGDR
jgi:hypothetical protein